jgi:hypothetical protein
LRWINSILNAMANAIWVTEQARMSLQPVGYKGASSPKKACGPIYRCMVSNGSIRQITAVGRASTYCIKVSILLAFALTLAVLTDVSDTICEENHA